jgi:RNA polymerase sigma factor (sigma-70 family)
VRAGAADTRIEDLLRELAPQVLGAVMRRFRDFDTAEDAVQEALVAAASTWAREGLPDNPRGWLIQVAFRRLTDHLRSEQARRRREDQVAAEAQREHEQATAAGQGGDHLGGVGGVGGVGPDEGDDTLVLLFMCCHPALSSPSAIALTLRAVGGLDTAEIARAFLVTEATMAQRISRAKQTVKASGVPFQMPSPEEWGDRLRAVLHVLYLIFNEGYTSSAGPDLQRRDLANEAIRLTRAVHRLRPDDGEVTGLLALMLLTDARRLARATADGDLVSLADQDRGLWDQAAIAEGVALVSGALARGAIGPYQLQAAIAAIHDEAASTEATDWPQILALYGLLEHMSPSNPMVMLNRAIAVAMVQGPAAGLELLVALDGDGRLAGHHRLDAVRAHLLEMSGDHQQAIAHYQIAASRTTSLPERRYLMARAARLGQKPE